LSIGRWYGRRNVVKQAKLLVTKLAFALSEAILACHEARGVFPDELEVWYLGWCPGQVQYSLGFEMGRVVEEGLGYPSLAGEVKLSKANKKADWWTGSLAGSAKVDLDGPLSRFTFEGKYEERKGMLVKVYCGQEKVAEFIV
jgi:hypothetical protein